MSIRQLYENDVVVLDRGEYTTCAINLCGAVITSWRIQNKEHVFMSRQALLYYLTRARGGLGVSFPKYGAWEFGRRHGFARDLKWTLATPPRRTDRGDVYAEFALANDEYTKSLWAHKFQLVIRITLREIELVMNFTVENTNEHFPMEFDFVHHCTFRVEDVAKCKVLGLQDCVIFDRNEPERRGFPKEEREEVNLFERTDRLYKDAPDVINIYLGEGKEVLKITKTNLPDFNLSNPWVDRAKELPDLGDDEYRYYLSTDCGTIGRRNALGPNRSWTCMITYEIIEPQEEKEEVDHFYNYFDKYCA